jgi:hypothetical protein
MHPRRAAIVRRPSNWDFSCAEKVAAFRLLRNMPKISHMHWRGIESKFGSWSLVFLFGFDWWMFTRFLDCDTFLVGMNVWDNNILLALVDQILKD